MPKLEYMIYFIYICISIVVGAAGAYYVVTMEDIEASAINQNESDTPIEEKNIYYFDYKSLYLSLFLLFFKKNIQKNTYKFIQYMVFYMKK